MHERRGLFLPAAPPLGNNTSPGFTESDSIHGELLRAGVEGGAEKKARFLSDLAHRLGSPRVYEMGPYVSLEGLGWLQF